MPEPKSPPETRNPTKEGGSEEVVIKISIPKMLAPPFLLGPRDARIHARQALREGLLALRSILDAGIADMDRGVQKLEKEREKVKKLEIE